MTAPNDKPADKPVDVKPGVFSAEQETALIDVVGKALSKWQADETTRRTEELKNNPPEKTLFQKIFSD